MTADSIALGLASPGLAIFPALSAVPRQEIL